MGSIVIPALLIFTGSPILFGWAKPVPYNPYNLKGQRWGETLVALAGSATNMLLAVIFGLMVRFGGTLGFDHTALVLAQSIAFVNLFLGLFNLIPFPPLDGFTALRSSLPWHMAAGLGRFEERARTMGPASLILFLLIFSYLFAGPFYTLVQWIFGLLIGSSI
jgi:Zn-dependent protease